MIIIQAISQEQESCFHKWAWLQVWFRFY